MDKQIYVKVQIEPRLCRCGKVATHVRQEADPLPYLRQHLSPPVSYWCQVCKPEERAMQCYRCGKPAVQIATEEFDCSGTHGQESKTIQTPYCENCVPLVAFQRVPLPRTFPAGEPIGAGMPVGINPVDGKVYLVKEADRERMKAMQPQADRPLVVEAKP